MSEAVPTVYEEYVNLKLLWPGQEGARIFGGKSLEDGARENPDMSLDEWYDLNDYRRRCTEHGQAKPR